MTEHIESLTPRNLPARWLRNYLPMWIGQAVSLLGSGLVQFALVWYMTEKTGSATVLAMATFVALLPRVFLGPFAGALVDRLNRKAIMIVSDTAVALATFALVVLFHLGITQIGIFMWSCLSGPCAVPSNIRLCRHPLA